MLRPVPSVLLIVHGSLAVLHAWAGEGMCMQSPRWQDATHMIARIAPTAPQGVRRGSLWLYTYAHVHVCACL